MGATSIFHSALRRICPLRIPRVRSSGLYQNQDFCQIVGRLRKLFDADVWQGKERHLRSHKITSRDGAFVSELCIGCMEKVSAGAGMPYISGTIIWRTSWPNLVSG